jgi:hypothetical protein
MEHAKAVRQYSMDTLELILRDLAKNPTSYRKGSWEQSRMKAITNELNRRRK